MTRSRARRAHDFAGDQNHRSDLLSHLYLPEAKRCFEGFIRLSEVIGKEEFALTEEEFREGLLADNMLQDASKVSFYGLAGNAPQNVGENHGEPRCMVPGTLCSR
ncbi:unnamed protein product [Durusdinium trenchii]|uniref:Uncharacterized protein n=1 Tax=Durusdinium trenchii TaxID=1381693 RepID=A0ABP0IIA5_9DINO